ncbi:MAG: mechanosensitive ion channel family protein [Bacteroidetes bacterium]|nr:MAG: mechanosensitive ion channel family protein [Bacteroidota bacterium]REK03529.1 MAG: mechanosensitive ion channel family protein [Bacteroidota bacterium]REK34832.1 MAG: mechanosensitive ion channel family protein [Bacteroidota bacterium]
MKKTHTLFHIWLAFLLFSIPSFSYSQDQKVKTEDSINLDSLTNAMLYVLKIDSARIADSMKRVQLEEELLNLKTSDNLKKQDLLQELERLKSSHVREQQSRKNRIDSLRNFVKGFPVNPFGDTILTVYTKLGSFSAKERAESIASRIKNLSNDVFFNPDSIKVERTESGIDLMFRDMIILSVTNHDALWMYTDEISLAQMHREKIKNSVTEHRKSRSVQTILKGFGMVLLVLLVLSVIIYFVNRLFKFTSNWISLGKDTVFKGVKIKDYELFTAERQVNFLSGLNNILRWFIIILAVYIALPILFGIFPWTKGIADTLLGYILNPLMRVLRAIWNYLPNLFTIIVLVFLFRYVLKGVKYLKSEIESGSLKITGFYPEWSNPTYQIIRLLIIAFFFVVVFPYLPGSDSPVFQGVSVFLGFLFTFGSAGSLSNIIAGLVLTYMRAFKIGDRVRIGDVTGDIIEKTLLVTRVRTIKNEDITIPNSNIMSSHTINYSSSSHDHGLIIHTTVTIGYDVPWKTVHALLVDAALSTDLVQKKPAPFVLQTSLDDFYVSYQINAYTSEPNKQAMIYSHLHQNIQDKFNESGVEIMSPHYRATRDGNLSTIPSDYLPKDYITPSFRVENTNQSK